MKAKLLGRSEVTLPNFRVKLSLRILFQSLQFTQVFYVYRRSSRSETWRIACTLDLSKLKRGRTEHPIKIGSILLRKSVRKSFYRNMIEILKPFISDQNVLRIMTLGDVHTCTPLCHKGEQKKSSSPPPHTHTDGMGGLATPEFFMES